MRSNAAILASHGTFFFLYKFFFIFILFRLSSKFFRLRPVFLHVFSFYCKKPRIGKTFEPHPNPQNKSHVLLVYAGINSEYFRCFSIKICTQITISKTFIVNLNQIYYKKSHNWHTFVPVRQ